MSAEKSRASPPNYHHDDNKGSITWVTAIIFPRSKERDILILMDTDTQQPDLVKHVLDAGFPLKATSLIHLFVGGSQLHGAKVSGYDDLDIYGCYIEPPEQILGVLPLEHYMWSSGSAKQKNTADDVDVTIYSLHRWGELIRKGNPAILHYLFAAMSSRRLIHGRNSLVPTVNN